MVLWVHRVGPDEPLQINPIKDNIRHRSLVVLREDSPPFQNCTAADRKMGRMCKLQTHCIYLEDSFIQRDVLFLRIPSQTVS